MTLKEIQQARPSNVLVALNKTYTGGALGDVVALGEYICQLESQIVSLSQTLEELSKPKILTEPTVSEVLSKI